MTNTTKKKIKTGTSSAAPSVPAKASSGTKMGKKDVKKKGDASPGLKGTSSPSADDDSHPLHIGHSISVLYRDGSNRLAKIIERMRKSESDEWQYYVHYYDFNRRMDEWITDYSRITIYPSEANLLAEDGHGAHDLGKADGKKHGSHSSRSSPTKSEIRKSLGFDEHGEDQKADAITTIAELEHDEHEGLDEAQLLEHEEITKIKNISNVVFGKYKMECWYFSPFPKECYPDGLVDCLYFCEFTFRFFKSKRELVRYQSKPTLPRHPPGNEIYRDSRVSMFELDGAVEKVYCQNLCYFAKLFLDHKTLYWDVDPFLFYVLCTHDDRGYHPVGFFSKEKYSDAGYNLACILTFPSAQRQGFGRFLIAFSYELSKKEEKVGSPEKPLSDLGAVSYKSYWASTLLVVLKNFPGQQLSVMDLTKITSILAEDVTATLQSLGILLQNSTGYVIACPDELLSDLMLKYPCTGLPVDPAMLQWAPLYVTDPKKDKWSIKSKKEPDA